MPQHSAAINGGQAGYDSGKASDEERFEVASGLRGFCHTSPETTIPAGLVGDCRGCTVLSAAMKVSRPQTSALHRCRQIQPARERSMECTIAICPEW